MQETRRNFLKNIGILAGIGSIGIEEKPWYWGEMGYGKSWIAPGKCPNHNWAVRKFEDKDYMKCWFCDEKLRPIPKEEKEKFFRTKDRSIVNAK